MSFYIKKRLSFFSPATSGVWIHELLSKQKKVWLVVEDNQSLYEAQLAIRAFNPTVDLLTYPQWDTLPYAAASPSKRLQIERQSVLKSLQRSTGSTVVLSTMLGACQKLGDQSNDSFQITLTQGDKINTNEVITKLTDLGFVRSETVYGRSEFCIRGGIVDIFPADSDKPYRIDLFGDEVESICTFDPNSQLRDSASFVQHLRIHSSQEILLTDDTLKRFTNNYSKHIPSASKAYYRQNILERSPPTGWEQLYPLFFDKTYTLMERFPEVMFLFPERVSVEGCIKDIQTSFQYRKELWETSAEEKLLPPLPPELLYCIDAQKEIFQQKNVKTYSPLKVHEAHTCGVKVTAPLVSQSAAERMKEAICHAGKKKLVIAVVEEKDVTRIVDLCESPPPHFKRWSEVLACQQDVVVWSAKIIHGIETSGCWVTSASELFGERKKNFKRSRPSIRAEDIIAQASQISMGDLVIHRQHGLGRYLGLETITVFAASHDCLILEYSGKDKLYLPVENIEMLSRYGSGEGAVVLDKIGGAAWQSRQLKVKKQLRTIAKYLMDIAAKRLLKTAPSIDLKEGAYDEFCKRFPFVETDDQLNAINDVVQDLGTARPMDRLVCGDVGFGKTEVALRAAFLAVSNGLQVGVITPTTILARQHYVTFVERFKGFGLNVSQVSRLVKPSEVSATKKALAEGDVSIVIGTHALLNSTFKYHQLGLLIVDEEQMFGVKQKEKIKEISENIHVLTLSATPIPRTLQLSLLGIKEMSLIATPPVDRRAIQTTICEEDPIVIYKAIEHEVERGGQVFYVCPRISDILNIEERIKKKMPDLKVAVAHGQLRPTEIEQQLIDFTEGKTQVLLSTQIIESGIDIPNANTMIVHNSHLFGLSQLYQLRGRIGRSSKQAFAYFTVPADRNITAAATKRLQVMSTLDTLGAGFTLASHDLDIRGAGNLLGEEQSGHIKDVGVELYQDMLKQAVSKLKKHAIEVDEEDDVWSPTIALGLSVGLPESYIPEIGLRMDLYRRLGSLGTNEDVNTIRLEFIDRFGPLPEEAENLMETLKLKILCRKASIQKLESGPNGVLITFRNNDCPYGRELINLVQGDAYYKLRPDSKLFYTWSISDISKRVRKIYQVCQVLCKLSEK